MMASACLSATVTAHRCFAGTTFFPVMLHLCYCYIAEFPCAKNKASQYIFTLLVSREREKGSANYQLLFTKQVK